MPCAECGEQNTIGKCSYGYGSCSREVCPTHGLRCPGCEGVFCSPHFGDHLNSSEFCREKFRREREEPPPKSTAPVLTEQTGSGKEPSLTDGGSQKDPGSFQSYYSPGICPSCGFGYEDTKILEWARLVRQQEETLACNAALREVCGERDLDPGWVDATQDDDRAKAAMEEARKRAPAHAVVLAFEEVEQIYSDIGVQSVDAHNVVGQNAVKTGTSRREQNRNGTHAILQNFYEQNHDCQAAKGQAVCLWTSQAGKLESLVGAGEVMNSAYCQTGQGAQCKICEAVQAEFHLLQRAQFLLEHAEVPLSFVGLQWCLAFRRGGREGLEQFLRANGPAFLDFLTGCTRTQIENNLGRLDRLIPALASESPAEPEPVTGSTSSVLKAVSTACPEVLVLVRQRWAAFCEFYRQQFLEVCRSLPGREMDLASIAERLRAVEADAIRAARALWNDRKQRPRLVEEQGFDCELKAGANLYSIITGAGLANSAAEAKNFIKTGKVTVSGVAIKDEKAKMPGESGDLVTVTVTKKKGDDSKIVKLI